MREISPHIRSAFIPALILGIFVSACGGALPCPDGPDPGVDFTGEWDSEWGRVRLTQRGWQAGGSYSYIAGDHPEEGRLEGVVSGRMFRFRWSEASGSGFGWFSMAGDGAAFVGEWWSEQGDEPQGWHGVRR